MLEQSSKKWLANLLGASVRFSEPMSRHTSFRVGGPAGAYAVPREESRLIRLLTGLWERGIPVLVVGDGTNLLVSDRGIAGVVVALSDGMAGVCLETDNGNDIRVKVPAALRTARLCVWAVDRGLTGTERLAGIPGTVGGAVRMNAGTALGTVGDLIRDVTLLYPDGRIDRVKRDRLRFSHRCCMLPGSDAGEPVILSATLALRPASDGSAGRRMAVGRLLAERKRRQPLRWPSAGCVFRNPADGPGAGALIDRAGLKGRRVGGAAVSRRHANFIINRDGATASDVKALMAVVQETVAARFGAQLVPEVRCVGD
jgi:UDP-N-acetylmuramate dehydrogenase